MVTLFQLIVFGFVISFVLLITFLRKKNKISAGRAVNIGLLTIFGFVCMVITLLVNELRIEQRYLSQLKEEFKRSSIELQESENEVANIGNNVEYVLRSKKDYLEGVGDLANDQFLYWTKLIKEGDYETVFHNETDRLEASFYDGRSIINFGFNELIDTTYNASDSLSYAWYSPYDHIVTFQTIYGEYDDDGNLVEQLPNINEEIEHSIDKGKVKEGITSVVNKRFLYRWLGNMSRDNTFIKEFWEEHKREVFTVVSHSLFTEHWQGKECISNLLLSYQKIREVSNFKQVFDDYNLDDEGLINSQLMMQLKALEFQPTSDKRFSNPLYLYGFWDRRFEEGNSEIIKKILVEIKEYYRAK